jgi:hypothetical protein
MNDKIIAYCGLVCTDCPAYLATQTKNEQKAEETAELWTRIYKVSVNVDDVWCDGCLVGSRKCAHCAKCEIRACGQKHAVLNCAYCHDYPCEQLVGFFGMAPDARKTLDRVKSGI